jgi:quercetin dioxygenase-like cupin family protein
MPTDQSGVMPRGKGMDGIVWDVLGQIYVPKLHNADVFLWDATLPPGTFVPPHIHPTQDEFLHIVEGELEFWLDGVETKGGPGDVVRMVRGVPHGIFNRSGGTVRTLFGVAPSRSLWALFAAIDGVADPAEVVRLAALHEVDFLPPPG